MSLNEDRFQLCRHRSSQPFADEVIRLHPDAVNQQPLDGGYTLFAWVAAVLKTVAGYRIKALASQGLQPFQATCKAGFEIVDLAGADAPN